MEMEFTKEKIKLNKVLSVLDEFVIDFITMLNELEIKYVIISGYVVLLFGSARITEDVDIFLEELDENKLKRLFEKLEGKYWIINAGSFNTAKDLYNNGDAWRVSRKDEIFPNMEIKKPKTLFDFTSLNHPIKVFLNQKNEINISPLELQIAFKLKLGSHKDLEDARYLYDLFKNNLDKKTLEAFAKELRVLDKLTMLVP